MKKLTVQDLQAIYPPMQETFVHQLDCTLAHLPYYKEELPVKKKLSSGLVLIVILSLLAAGALAAAIHWNVMDFLFGGENEQAAPLVSELQTKTTDGQVTLQINSALCDGETLALDWTIQNTRPEQPVLMEIEDFTVDGERIWGDGNDGFDNQWLPGWCNDGGMRDGESVALPQNITDDQCTVSLTVCAYRPIRPIYHQEVYNPEEARKKLDAGYFVIPEGDGYVIYDKAEEQGVAWGFGSGNDWATLFTRTEMRISFEIDIAAGRAAQTQLKGLDSYQFPEFTASYTKAILTPVGLYLSLEVNTIETDANAALDAGSFELTDGEGSLLDSIWPSGETSWEANADGTIRVLPSYIWIGVSHLPNEVSLSWISRDGMVKHVMPVTIFQ